MTRNFQCTLLLLIIPLFLYGQDGNRISDSELGISFVVPEAWEANKEGDRYILGTTGFNGFALIKTEQLHSISELEDAMNKGIELTDGSKLMPVEDLKLLGQQGVSGIYRGTIDEVEMTGYLMALMSPSKQKTVLCISISPTPQFNQSNLDYVKILLLSVIFD